MPSRLKLKISGRVQGVFFRQSTVEHARTLRLAGWVTNDMDGSVLVNAEGEREQLESLLIWCKKGPPSAQVTEVQVEWIDDTEPEFTRFEVRR